MTARNLIVVCFDTLRRDAVTTDLCRTPNLDAFAATAVDFTNAWGEGLPTVPFRRAVHTGWRSYPWRHHVADRGSHPNGLGWHPIPDNQTTLAEYLYLRGYATGMVSDLWHAFKANMNFIRGFVSWEFIRGQEGDTYTLAAEALAEPSPYGGRRVGPPTYLYQTRERRRDEDYFPARVLDTAATWVEGNATNRPYFLWVDSFAPHEFWDPPQSFADAYHPADPARRDHIVPQALNPGAGRAEADPEDIARARALYQGYVTFCDERFGRFMDRLERAGALADSIVVVLSDHGTELMDQGRFGKSADRLHPYNTQINLMIRHPDIRSRQPVGAFVSNVDLTPTLLDLLGVPRPALEGQNVWPQTRTAPDPGFVITGWDTMASVRDSRYNLIVPTQAPAGLRLYDREADPGETRDVAAAHPGIVAGHLGRLEALLGAPLPANYVHRPGRGFGATPGGLRQIRAQRAAAGERWEGSNLV